MKTETKSLQKSEVDTLPSTENFTVKDWAAADRPREKMARLGAEALSDAELLAIILGSGTPKETVVDLARRVLAGCGNSLATLARMSVTDLTRRFKGVGPAKAVAVLAAFELGRRRSSGESAPGTVLRDSRSVYQLMRPRLMDLSFEESWALFLNASNKLLDMKRISQGGINETVVDIRLVLKYAVDRLATVVILCHNHPSGNCQPSRADDDLTMRLRTAAKSMGLFLADHVIVAENRYFSYADQGRL